MYICQLYQEVVPPHTPAHRIAIEVRPRQYPRRADANPKSRKRKSGYSDDPGGTGYETVREITVCPACTARHMVIEEKIDGANAAISFGADGRLLPQSRGHYLTGGQRERHFALFKAWAHTVEAELRPVLGRRYIVYGEWLYAKHTIFHDMLPHYFLEFDMLDRETGAFLSTRARRKLLAGLPLVSVPVLHGWEIATPAALKRLIAPSLYKSPGWRERLAVAVEAGGHHGAHVDKQTDASGLAEGLYIKVEDGGRVTGRFKYVRHDFLTAVLDSASHWQSRPILPNQLAPGLRLPGMR